MPDMPMTVADAEKALLEASSKLGRLIATEAPAKEIDRARKERDAAVKALDEAKLAAEAREEIAAEEVAEADRAAVAAARARVADLLREAEAAAEDFVTLLDDAAKASARLDAALANARHAAHATDKGALSPIAIHETLAARRAGELHIVGLAQLPHGGRPKGRLIEFIGALAARFVTADGAEAKAA